IELHADLDPSARRELDRLETAADHTANDDGVADPGVAHVAKVRYHVPAPTADVSLPRPGDRADGGTGHGQDDHADDEIVRVFHRTASRPRSQVTAQNASSTRMRNAE